MILDTDVGSTSVLVEVEKPAAAIGKKESADC
jgi:hypothetical protein